MSEICYGYTPDANHSCKKCTNPKKNQYYCRSCIHNQLGFIDSMVCHFEEKYINVCQDCKEIAFKWEDKEINTKIPYCKILKIDTPEFEICPVKEKELANKISDFIQELHESVIYISNQDEGDMIENAIFDILKERLL